MGEVLEIEDILTEPLSSTITTTSTTTTTTKTTTMKTTSILVAEPLEQNSEIIINQAVITEIPIINDMESLSSTITTSTTTKTTTTTTTTKTTSTLVPEPLEQNTEIITNPAVMTEIPIINDKEYTTIETREKSEALQTTIASVQSEEIITNMKSKKN